MKDKIVEAAIHLLKKKGLKFSVDDLAADLKMAKKTIYRFFPSKETLANAIYETAFDQLEGHMDSVVNLKKKTSLKEMLKIYGDGLIYMEDDIFNRFCLNLRLKHYGEGRLDGLWQKMISYLQASSYAQLVHETALRTLLNASLVKINEEEEMLDSLIRILFGVN